MSLDFYEHSRANLALLKRRFPDQFDVANIGQEWPDGWHDLVVDVCVELNAAHLHPRWVQIKEKLGGLRMYFEGAPLRIDLHGRGGPLELTRPSVDARVASIAAVTARAEHLSHQRCMKCGKPGSTNAHANWLVTLCAADSQRYKRARTR